MGRHEREEPRPYENTGSGLFERALLAFLGFWHRNLVDPVGDFFSRTADKLWGLPRSRRWAICPSLGALTLVLAVVVIQAVIQGDKRDYAITTTQVVEQGVLLEEDYAACMMSIDLQGRTIAAETSCATNASFPAEPRSPWSKTLRTRNGSWWWIRCRIGCQCPEIRGLSVASSGYC